MERIEVAAAHRASCAPKPAWRRWPSCARAWVAELSDEEFLLRATMPASQVDAMRAAGPAARHYDPASRPVMELLRRVLKLRDVSELSIEKQRFRLRAARCQRSAAVQSP